MKRICPNLDCASPDFVIRDGVFWRQDDSKLIQRFRCTKCRRRFSSASFSESYRFKKRRIHMPLLRLLSSGVSLRRSARLLKVHRVTVERKLTFLAKKCRRLNKNYLNSLKGKVHNIQLDDLVTKENSKLKPLSVSVVVDADRRSILALEVSQIPAFGHLAKLAVKKYGHRKSHHRRALKRVFEQITPIVSPEVLIKTDEHAFYPHFVSNYLPRAKHLCFKSERSHVAGQGELKKVSFDPLFMINHTCAMLRANVNRLIRRTWCTTKDPLKLKDHLDVFMFFYNQELLKKALTPL